MSMDQHQQEIEMEKTAKKRQANDDCMMEVLCVLNNILKLKTILIKK